ncbi:MAG: prolipoprotein diacylglyceryl transferase [Candidatus Eremiobacteraeota bacterium]|nr:prolipoprotein diacylglyceryl transferase [Candidatus Eremiobacteraeota bacterium]
MDSLSESTRWLAAAPVYAVAYGCGLLVFAWMARRRGLATAGIWLLMQAAVFGGLIGANLVQLLATGLPGKTIEGGFIGGYIAVVLMKRHLGIRRPTGDLFALAFPAGEAIGRIACFIGGCCYGKVTAAALALHDHGAYRYPTQLFMAACAAASFAFLLWIERKYRLPENGLFYTQGILFCMSRFIIEFFREGSTFAGSMTLAQLGCIAGFAFFATKFTQLIRTQRITARA